MDLSTRISPCIFLSVFSALPLLNYPESGQRPFLLAHVVVVVGAYMCGRVIQSYQGVQKCASYFILVMDIAAFLLTSTFIQARDYVHPESLYIGLLLVLLCGNTRVFDREIVSAILRWTTFVYIAVYQLSMACGEEQGVASAAMDLVTSTVICSLLALAYSCDIRDRDEAQLGGAWVPVSLLVVSLVVPRIMWWNTVPDGDGGVHNFLDFRNAFQACDGESSWSHNVKFIFNMIAKLAFIHGCRRRLGDTLAPIRDREWKFFVAGGLVGLALYTISTPDEYAPTTTHTSNILGSFMVLVTVCVIYTTLCIR